MVVGAIAVIAWCSYHWVIRSAHSSQRDGSVLIDRIREDDLDNVRSALDRGADPNASAAYRDSEEMGNVSSRPASADGARRLQVGQDLTKS